MLNMSKGCLPTMRFRVLGKMLIIKTLGYSSGRCLELQFGTRRAATGGCLRHLAQAMKHHIRK